MRLRAACTLLALLSGLAAPLAGPASATDTYTAFTADAPAGGWFADGGVRTADVTATGDATGVTVAAAGSPAWTATLTPPTGTALEIGTYPTASVAAADTAGLDVRSGTSACATSTGSLTVLEIAFGEGGAVTALAASYSQTCAEGGGAVHGELRIASATAYRALELSPLVTDLGDNRVVGRRVSGPEYVLTNTGTAPVTVGSLGFGGGNPSDWSVAGEDCTATPLQPGLTCKVQTSFRPAASGARSATFVVGDDTRRGGRTATLTASATRAHLVYVETTDEASILWLADYDNNRIREIARMTDGDISQPRLSPDGTRVSYASDADDGYYHVYVRPVAGGPATQVTTGPHDDDLPVWSPDGAWLAFSRYSELRDAFDVYRVRSDGTGLTSVASNALTGSYSPSGRQLAVTREDGRLEIVTLATRARHVVPGGSGWMVLPDWSPDGRRIVYVSYAGGPTTTLQTIPVTGGTPTPLFPTAGSDWSPVWSTDGTEVYFWRQGTASTHLRRVDADGTGGAVIATGIVTDLADVSAFAAPPPTDDAPPAAPTVKGAIDGGKVSLSWNSVAEATEYVVRRGNAGEPAPATPGDGTPVYAGGARSAVATGLTNRSTYAFSVFALDPHGNAARTTLSATPLGLPAVRPPALVPLASSTTSWTVSWSGAGASGFEVQYGVRTRSSSGSWSAPAYRTWTTAPGAASATLKGLPGNTYWFRVRAKDAFGNYTPWSVAKPSSVALNENYYGIGYSSGWTSSSAAGRWMGTLRTAATAGRTLTYTAETAGFNVFGERCSTCGQVRIYVDGKLKATVDTRGTGVRQNLWSISFSGGIKRHTIQLVTVGTAGRPKVAIDGIGLYR